MKSSRHKFELGHVDELRKLRTRVDPNVTSTAMCYTEQGNPPECELAKESKLRKLPYLIDSPRSLLR